MDSEEERRINVLFDTVLEEEARFGIRTGDCVRRLFVDEHRHEDNIASDDDDDGFGILQEDIPRTEEDDFADEQLTENVSQIETEDYGDSDDIQEIPLALRIQGNNIVKRRNGQQCYLSKDGKMLWDLEPPSNQGRSRARNVVRVRTSYVAGEARDCKSPLEVWKLFFTDNMIEEITFNTNIYIDTIKDNYNIDRHCKPTNSVELRAVIGLLYMLGVMKMSHLNLEDVWSRDSLGIEFFPLVMPLYRFKFLLRALRFDNIHTREDRKLIDRLAPIRDIFEEFVENCQKHYNVSPFVTVDEMLEAFRGRCGFRQYIKSKPARYGVKIFAMCCAKSFYTSNLEIYAGSQPDGPFKIDNSGQSVVNRLIQPISGTGRNVTVDNWFCSVPLCSDLLHNHRLTLVGTLRKNKKEIPPNFIDLKKVPVGASQFGFKESFTLVSYKAKKNKQVVLLSSMHSDDAIDNNVDSPTYGKPEIILFYNSSKGGVDTVDKFKEHYSVARTTNRWSMTVFYSLLNISSLNSYIILKENTNAPNMKRRHFLQELAKDLCKEQMTSRIDVKSTPSWVKKRLRDILDVPAQARQPPAEEVTSGRCYACDWRKNRASKTRCATCKFFICKEHSAPVHCTNCTQENNDVSDNE